jgi:ATP-dependent Clp protease adaptor protein ClpS
MKSDLLNTLLPELDEEVLLLVKEKTEDVLDIVLYNDDVNTFDFVIESLIRYCDHDPIQAEQCTFLVHYTGKCAVKKGSFKDLKPICSALLEQGLTAEIQ